MGRRLLTAWESLPPRRQIIVGTPLVFVVLAVFHAMFFPNLTLLRTLSYALMEALPLALVITYATQVELVRRESATEDGAGDGQQHTAANDAQSAGIDIDPAIIDPAAMPNDRPNSAAGHADL